MKKKKYMSIIGSITYSIWMNEDHYRLQPINRSIDRSIGRLIDWNVHYITILCAHVLPLIESQLFFRFFFFFNCLTRWNTFQTKKNRKKISRRIIRINLMREIFFSDCLPLKLTLFWSLLSPFSSLISIVSFWLLLLLLLIRSICWFAVIIRSIFQQSGPFDFFFSSNPLNLRIEILHFW